MLHTVKFNVYADLNDVPECEDEILQLNQLLEAESAEGNSVRKRSQRVDRRCAGSEPQMTDSIRRIRSVRVHYVHGMVGSHTTQ